MPRILRQEQFKKKALSWLNKTLSLYYRNARLLLPEDMDRREFAYQPLGKNTYVRHLSFKDPHEVSLFFSKNPPLHAYYSSAKYAFPEIPDMEQKRWLGSELIFDIDADHLRACTVVEQLHICMSCGYNMRGFRIAKCPNCGSQEVVEAETLPSECISAAAREAEKLVRVLRKDLGIKKVRAFFSGNRGFHVHTECDENILMMNSDERREIVDYIKGVGLDLKLAVLLSDRRKSSLIIPRPGDPGWRGRVGEELYRTLGLPENQVLTWGEAASKHGVKGLEEYVENARIEIDEKVTIDVHRLVRIPGSLNGKTGLPVVEVAEGELRSFEISASLSPLKGRIEIMLLAPVKEAVILGFPVSGDSGEKLEVPHSVAMFLMLRGVASPVGEQ